MGCEILIAIIFAPRDRLSVNAGEEDIQVSIAIHVCGSNALNHTPVANIMSHEVLEAVVLVPGNLVIRVVVEGIMQFGISSSAATMSISPSPSMSTASTAVTSVACHIDIAHALEPLRDIIAVTGVGGIIMIEWSSTSPSKAKPVMPRSPAVLKRKRSIGDAIGGPTGHVEVQRVFADGHRHAVGDLLARSAPIAVAVEVDPGVELGRTALHVDGRGNTQAPT